MTTVEELIAKLAEFPGWHVTGTCSRSLEVHEPYGTRYGWVYPSDLPARIVTDRKRKAGTPCCRLAVDEKAPAGA